jgi:20S proteasome alpha/beta subunit
MTLIISVRSPEGIVIAADSLSTAKEKEQLSSTTFSHTQKIFPFYGKYGVGIFGAGLIANEAVSSTIRLFEEDLKEKGILFKEIIEIGQKLGDYFHNLLKDQLETENKSLDILQPNQFAYGFQIIGYDNTDPKTVEVHVGQKVHYRVREEFGSTYSGSGEIVHAIWGLSKTHPDNQHPYPLFSLQDAIDYADFLIRTTIAHQQFSLRTPEVGGDIDIAVVTLFDGFQWIRQKPLNQILKGNQDGTSSDS